MPYWFIVIPLSFVLGGMWSFFAPDLAWTMKEALFRRRGLVTQKPDDWNQRQRREGLTYIIGGIVLAGVMAAYYGVGNR